MRILVFTLTLSQKRLYFFLYGNILGNIISRNKIQQKRIWFDTIVQYVTKILWNINVRNNLFIKMYKKIVAV